MSPAAEKGRCSLGDAERQRPRAAPDVVLRFIIAFPPKKPGILEFVGGREPGEGTRGLQDQPGWGWEEIPSAPCQDQRGKDQSRI